jgi:hypothetical protein
MTSLAFGATRPTPARAACPPIGWTVPLEATSVFATRAKLEASAQAVVSELGGFEEWRIELATSPGGPWVLGASGSAPNGIIRVLIRELKPETHYYAKAQARTPNCGELQSSTDFTTTPVGKPEISEFEPVQYQSGPHSHSSEIGTNFANFRSHIETDGAETSYHFEYSASRAQVEAGSGTPIAASPPGPISVAAEFADQEAKLSGLTPETTYYIRLVAENEKGSSSQIQSFATASPKPRVFGGREALAAVANVTDTSFTVQETLIPQNSETSWRFEYSESESGPWASGPSGTIVASEADEEFHRISAEFSGLSPSTRYYFRFHAENAFGLATTPIVSVETAGPPHAAAFATHTFAPNASEAFRILGSVTPDDTPLNEAQNATIAGSPTGGTFTLTFEGEETEPIPAHAIDDQVAHALEQLPVIKGHGVVRVTGPYGGPYRLEFVAGLGGTNLPQMTANGSGLTPAGSVSVGTEQDGSSPPTHYHLEYTEQEKFEQEGWAGAESTSQLDAGAGKTQVVEGELRAVFVSEFTAADLPLLTPGKTYRYRMIAENPYGSVVGEERTLVIPSKPALAEESCPNESLRSGTSARLPNCRAYEQVTPVDKEGTTEMYQYGGGLATNAIVGEDGDHFFFESQVVKWGPNTSSKFTGYLFSRQGPGNWSMTSSSPQPASGVNNPRVALQSPDFATVGVESDWDTLANKSREIELAAGPFGGPYTTVTSMPRSDVPGQGDGRFWLGASADMSNLVFWTDGRKVLGKATGTASGADLYEFAQGQLRQLNVFGAAPGATIGKCGARLVHGFEGYERGSPAFTSAQTTSHSISANGSRAFFEAVPGSNCSDPKHLYMRVGGAETIDLGEYRFLAANPEGTRLLLEHQEGGSYEFFSYDTATASANHLFTTHHRLSEIGEFPSPTLSDFYFMSQDQLTPDSPSGGASLYRYDLVTEHLELALPGGMGQPGNGHGPSVSPDGRYFYWTSQGIPGVPPGNGDEVYRYDSSEHVVQCISCVSSFNPDPRQASTYLSIEGGVGLSRDQTPEPVFASADGSYVFFDTYAALLPQDIDGELAPETPGPEEQGLFSTSFSPSSDVYEWRKLGVDGCADLQGCLSLISTGQGGFLVMLLGTTPSGRDVFFTSRSQLASTDGDNAIDVYDARIGGGTPPPALRPVECEGDACSHPVPPPTETTPSSLNYQGPGNEHPARNRRKHKKHRKAKHHKRSHKRAVRANRGGHQ